MLSHLGILQLFLGGTDKIGFPPDTFSHTSEWSGLIGQNYITVAAGVHTWLVFGPLIMLSLSIIAFSFMAEGFKKSSMQVFGKRGRSKKKITHEEPPLQKEFSFEPVYCQLPSVG